MSARSSRDRHSSCVAASRERPAARRPTSCFAYHLPPLLMDVLTCAASTFSDVTSSCAAASAEMAEPSAEAQIAALKRKLIDMDRSLNGARERISGLEKVLEMEKREHQLTTSKLTVLLKKRGAACAQCAAPLSAPRSSERRAQELSRPCKRRCEQRRLAGSDSGDSIGYESGSNAFMAGAWAARTAHQAQESGSELPPHAQPRVCDRKAAPENAVRTAARGG